MTTWTSEELRKIGEAEELRVASLRRDGTLRNWVTIWVVRLDDELYVRSVNGRGAGWFRGTQTRHEGRVRAGGIEKDVSFLEESSPEVNDRIDAVYRSKYGRYGASLIDSMISRSVRAATLKLVPRV